MDKYIKLINHASIFLSNGKKSILTDPWYSGSVFDDGWKLLYENEISEIVKILNETTFIWISHEHPDHFSINFFRDYGEIIKKNKITIIFQKTQDSRVVNFLKKNNFIVTELQDNNKFYIDDDFWIKIQKSDFYDSALIININGTNIFNLNDCPLVDDTDILKFKKNYGSCDFLLTQFSYAAWKGGKQNINWRVKAAEQKLNTIINQSKLLNAKYIIPFASYIYFCDLYNFYLNDSVNTPLKVSSIKNNLDTEILFLKPGQYLNLDKPSIDNEEGYNFWQEKFLSVKNLIIKKTPNEKIYDFSSLEEQFYKYYFRIFSKNSIVLSKVISKIKFLKIFQPLIINIQDINLKVKIDLLNKVFSKTNDDADIEMRSRSLFLIFNQDFGFDTLTINGCFEELKKNGFVKMTQSLALGNLNNLGIYLNSSIIFNFKIIFLFLKKIISLQKKLSYKYIQSIE
jgi:hypothetical protein